MVKMDKNVENLLDSAKTKGIAAGLTSWISLNAYSSCRAVSNIPNPEIIDTLFWGVLSAVSAGAAGYCAVSAYIDAKKYFNLSDKNLVSKILSSFHEKKEN
jgi:hypothetical protein